MPKPERQKRHHRRARINPASLQEPEPAEEMMQPVVIAAVTAYRDEDDQLVFEAHADDWVLLLDPSGRVSILEDSIKALEDLIQQERARLGDAPDNLRVIDPKGDDDDDA